MTAMDTKLAKPGLERQTHAIEYPAKPDVPAPRDATRKSPPHARAYSANRLRSYASRPKQARSIAISSSISDIRKGRRKNRIGLSVILYFRPLGRGLVPLAGKKRKSAKAAIDKPKGVPHTRDVLQLSGNYESADPLATLYDLRRGEAGVVDRIDLPGDDARRLMELGFLPGAKVTAGLSAPGGDPKVFQVDGSEVALRRETARHMKIRRSHGK
jgi:Fe2+ transport system protein FeoA